MNLEDLDRKIDKRADATDAEVKSMRKDFNGRLRKLELAKAKLEGALLGGRALPSLVALAATGAAWVAVLTR